MPLKLGLPGSIIASMYTAGLLLLLATSPAKRLLCEKDEFVMSEDGSAAYSKAPDGKSVIRWSVDTSGDGIALYKAVSGKGGFLVTHLNVQGDGKARQMIFWMSEKGETDSVQIKARSCEVR
jgi:hypothetical protein